MATLISLGSGIALAVCALYTEWTHYRERLGRIADDIRWHVEYRDRTQ